MRNPSRISRLSVDVGGVAVSPADLHDSCGGPPVVSGASVVPLPSGTVGTVGHGGNGSRSTDIPHLLVCINVGDAASRWPRGLIRARLMKGTVY